MIRPKAKLTPEEIEAKNEDAYEHLLSLIEDTQGQMALIIAACDSMAQREQIVKRYEADAWEEEKVRPFRIRLGQEPSLRAGLVALEEEHPYLKEEGKAVVSVTGAELLLRVKITGDEAQTELEKFFGYLQWTREALRAFKYPVVLWVSREILRELSRRAPDFWSWRKAVLRFEDEAVEESSVKLKSSQLSNKRAEFPVGVLVGVRIGLPEREADLPPLESLLEEIAVLEAREPESYGLATLYHQLGQVYAQRVRRGETTAAAESRKAIEAFQQGIERYQAQGNLDAAATALNRLAGFYDDQSQFEEASQTAQSALDAARQASNPFEEMIALRRVGNTQLSLGNFQQSIEHYQESLEKAKTIEDQKGEAAALSSLGKAYGSLKDYQKAIAFYSQSLTIYQETGSQQSIANSLTDLGTAYYFLEQYQKAIAFYSQSLEIQQEIGDQRSITNSLDNLGHVYCSLSDYHKAIALYSQSLEIQQKISARNGEANSYRNLGFAQAKINDAWAAKQSLEQAKAIFIELKLDHEVKKCGEALCIINDLLAKYPDLATTPYVVKPEPQSAEASHSEEKRRLVASRPNQLPWHWFLICLSLFILLGWLLG